VNWRQAITHTILFTALFVGVDMAMNAAAHRVPLFDPRAVVKALAFAATYIVMTLMFRKKPR